MRVEFKMLDSDMVLVLLTFSDFIGTGSQLVEHFLAGKLFDRMPMDVKVISLDFF
jgi:hypothetical protein